MRKFLLLTAAAIMLVGCSSPTESTFRGHGLTYDQGAQKIADAYWTNPLNQLDFSGFAKTLSFYYERDGAQAVGLAVMVRVPP